MKTKKLMALVHFVFLISCLGMSFLYAQTNLREELREKRREAIKERILRQIKDKEENQGYQHGSTGDYNYSLNLDGNNRKYKVHIPKSYNKNFKIPLVLAFHGGGGNNEMMSNDEYYHLISKSEEAGFIIVFPNGASQLSSGKLATWNAGNCCGYARDSNSDDVGFTGEIIKDMEAEFNIDQKRVFALGFSNGGMFAYRLACEMSDTFRAIASVSGTDNYDNCYPKNPVSILHIHAKDDGHVLFNGGAGAQAFRDKTKVTEFVSVADTVSKWVSRNNCNPVSKRVLDKEGVYCDVYSECENGVCVEVCVTETGGHSWPGGKKSREQADNPTNIFSATDQIWEFFNNK